MADSREAKSELDGEIAAALTGHMHWGGSSWVLGTMLSVGASVMIGCADRNVAVDDAGSSQTASSSTDSSEDPDDGSSSSSTSTSETSTSETSTVTTNMSDTVVTLSFVPNGGDEWGGDGCSCDPFFQDCPEGEKCVPYATSGETWDCTKCVPLLGDQAVGEPCSYGGLVEGTDDCDAESHCLTTESEGTCLAFCKGTADDPICDPGTTCVIMNQGNINLCMVACDPLLQDCGEGLGCYFAELGFACIFSGEIPTGEPCEATFNSCAPGNICVEVSPRETVCVAFCDLNNPVCIDECIPLFMDGFAPPTHEDVGVCLSPP